MIVGLQDFLSFVYILFPVFLEYLLQFVVPTFLEAPFFVHYFKVIQSGRRAKSFAAAVLNVEYIALPGFHQRGVGFDECLESLGGIFVVRISCRGGERGLWICMPILLGP